MRKEITIEKMMLGEEKMNKTELVRQYNCCWRTIDRRLNTNKYNKVTSMSNIANVPLVKSKTHS